MPERWIIVHTCCGKGNGQPGLVFEPSGSAKVPDSGPAWKCGHCGTVLRGIPILRYFDFPDLLDGWIPRDWCRKLPDLDTDAELQDLREGLPAKEHGHA
jgi:hypothetical protein